jgi:hypothetical protein
MVYARDRLWRSYCCPTAAKASIRHSGAFTFLRVLQANKRADERTRTAYPCSLRVIIQALQGFARGCKSPCLRGFLFPGLPTIAGYCMRVRVKLGSSGVKSPWITRRRFLRRPDLSPFSPGLDVRRGVFCSLATDFDASYGHTSSRIPGRRESSSLLLPAP